MTNEGGPAASQPDAGRFAGAALRSRRVAIVEDEFLVAWNLETLLEDAGHEVVGIFASGEDALAGLANHPVDLVCMDINLGKGIDGIRTAAEIRAKQAPEIIFITAYSDPATAKRALEAVPGAIMLGKPVTAGTLKDALERSGPPAN